MPSRTALYEINQDIWVVDPLVPTLYSGTINKIVFSDYVTVNSISSSLIYHIFANQLSTTISSGEEYITLTKQEGLDLLATLIDTNECQ
jgi:hypothetical protein